MTSQRNFVFILITIGIIAGMVAPIAAMQQKAGNPEKQLVNINTADTVQLEKLPRVGPKMAQRIIEFRKTNGGFKKLQDLMKVKGIGQKIYDQLKDQIAI